MRHGSKRRVQRDRLSCSDGALSGRATGTIGDRHKVGTEGFQLTNRLPELTLLDLILGWKELEREQRSIARGQQVGNARRMRAPETIAARHANTLRRSPSPGSVGSACGQ